MERLHSLQVKSYDRANNNHLINRQFWAPTPQECREKVMPFFWGQLMKNHGSVAGNPNLSSSVQLKNSMRYSYPGYSELLLGEAHPVSPRTAIPQYITFSVKEVTTNSNVQNTYTTLPEFLKQHFSLPKEKVATFASWETIRFVAEKEPGSTTTNTGRQYYEHSAKDPEIETLNKLQFEALTPWDSVRHDAFTHKFAMVILHLIFKLN
jgi:hypothetical protein